MYKNLNTTLILNVIIQLLNPTFNTYINNIIILKAIQALELKLINILIK